MNSAGVRDSALTNHGVLQTERLGESFRKKGVLFTNMFSSDLQRAFKTAEAILTAQSDDEREGSSPVTVRQLSILREKNFGSLEGKHVLSTTSSPRRKAPPKEVNNFSEEKEDSDYQDVESQESMIARMDEFLDKYLLILLEEEASSGEKTVAVVSHGITLTVLWRCILRRFPSTNISGAPDVQVRPGRSWEYLGFWSNTGYLELDFIRKLLPQSSSDIHLTLESADIKDATVQPSLLGNWRLIIKAINERGHLANLGRTGGGVGSSKHDSGQQKIEKFFKKQKGG